MDITKELQEFNLTDAAIAELKERYKDLAIKDEHDTVGAKVVHEAKMDIVRRRTGTEKIRQGLKKESLDYGRKIDGEAQRIFALLAPIEARLEEEENRIKEIKDRIKREAAEVEEARINARERCVEALGMTMVNNIYGVLAFTLPHDLLVSATDEQFGAFCEKVAAGVKADADYKAELKRAEDVEKARLQKVAEDQAAERKKLDEEKADLAAEKKRIQDKIDADAAEEKRKTDLKEATEKAAAKATQDEKDRVTEAARFKEAREKKEADVAARKAARAPDKEKLSNLGILILRIPLPDMKTEEGQAVLDWAGQEIMKLVKELKRKAEAL
jgi:hypothetical protein